MAEISLSHFTNEEEPNDFTIDEVITLDSFPYWSQINGSNSISIENRKNQVNFVMDLFHQRVDQSNLMGLNDFQNYDLGQPCFDLELGLGFQFGDYNNNNDCNNGDGGGGFVLSECGDEFFIFRSNDEGNIGNSSSIGGGLRLAGLDSDSDSDSDADIVENNEEDADYEVDNLNGDEDVDADDIGIPLCWDSLHLEDDNVEDGNNEFEWEEIDGRVVDEREVLTIVADSYLDDDDDDDDDYEETISVLPISGPEDEVRAPGGLGTLEWEVLLNSSHLDRNLDVENFTGPFLDDNDELLNTSEYEMMFGQFNDGDHSFMGKPPASKSVVKKLPSVVISEEDVANENALCAVCKDQIGVGEEGKLLPCSHRYHGECIVPWLEIRNTCPVCRYELPTDDAEYEQTKIRIEASAQ